jgi:hypothetical protein
MGTITLKEVDEVTNRVFNRVADDAAGTTTFVNLGTGSFGAARKLSFSLKVPANLATGRINIRQKIIVPFVREDGTTEITLADCTYLIPASLNATERMELWVLNKHLNLDAVEAELLRNLNLPQ